jgi:hypothetical protein
MAAGITCTAVLMAFPAEMLITRRLNHAIGRRRARGMSGHVVVGLGAFGVHVAGTLVASGKPVVVIERDPENRFLADAQALGVPAFSVTPRCPAPSRPPSSAMPPRSPFSPAATW